ncbi:M50 family metallopeptidase [Kiritimatiellaeota bacterium B1221]|nr:M50 family metallopeptidase [Kiritimatiellaeota bacterium B1221]
MFGTFHLFTVRDVPIRIHFTVFFLFYLFRDSQTSFLYTLLFAVLLLLSVALHELGHTVVAQRYGFRVKDIILTPIGGVARTIGFPEDPHTEVRIALAGPYVSLALALFGGAWAFFTYHTFLRWSTFTFMVFAAMNLSLFLFNLLPSFPMDGGRILRGTLALKKGPLEATRIAALIGKIFAVIFIILGIRYDLFSLLIIGVFILLSAGSEYRMMKIKAWQQGSVSPPPPVEPDFVASPPPYEKSPAKLKMPKGFLGDILITAKDLYQEICKPLFKQD